MVPTGNSRCVYTGGVARCCSWLWVPRLSLWSSQRFWEPLVSLNRFVFCLNQPKCILVFATESLTDKYYNLAFKKQTRAVLSSYVVRALEFSGLPPMEG